MAYDSLYYTLTPFQPAPWSCLGHVDMSRVSTPHKSQQNNNPNATLDPPSVGVRTFSPIPAVWFGTSRAVNGASGNMHLNGSTDVARGRGGRAALTNAQPALGLEELHTFTVYPIDDPKVSNSSSPNGLVWDWTVCFEEPKAGEPGPRAPSTF